MPRKNWKRRTDGGVCRVSLQARVHRFARAGHSIRLLISRYETACLPWMILNLDAKSNLSVSTARGADVPDWYPAWAKELADLYYSGSVCLFLLHGNVHDLIGSQDRARAGVLQPARFLSKQLFGSWDIVFSYDLGRGLRLEAGEDARRRQEMVEFTSSTDGQSQHLAARSRSGAPCSGAGDSAQPASGKSGPAQADRFPVRVRPVPGSSGGLNMLARGEASRLVRLISWAQNPYIKRVNMAFCLIANKLSEIE